MQERLQKIIARAGIASRRHAEQLIVSGQVQVNGRVVAELGAKADPARDALKVAGKLLHFPEAKLYVALHKPDRCVATMSDPEGRLTLQPLLRGLGGRVFPIGRLPYHAAGLLLLTSDGELAARLLRASRRGLEQTYRIKVKGRLSEAELQQVAAATGARIRTLEPGANAWYEVVLTEVRRDVLRHRLVRSGHPVEKLRRIRIANVELGALAPGQFRHLTPAEVAGLDRAAQRVVAAAGESAPRRADTRAKPAPTAHGRR